MPASPSPETEHRDIRQRAILELLRARAVASQGELVELLLAREIQATQSSVSRDLRELGVARVAGRYMPPSEEREPGLRDMARFLRSARPAGPHLTVLLTTAGTAPSVGIALDRAAWPEIVGTMAGDDTVFIATASATDQGRLLENLARFLEEER